MSTRPNEDRAPERAGNPALGCLIAVATGMWTAAFLTCLSLGLWWSVLGLSIALVLAILVVKDVLD